jgi:hypothetical protein
MPTINETYTVALTREEYYHLLRIAPDGIQAAMEGSLKITPLRLSPSPAARKVIQTRIDYPVSLLG